MPLQSPESLVEERVAKLEAISERRNVLLRQMYHMMRRRENVGSVLAVEDEDEDEEEFHVFMDRYDLNKNPDTGAVTNIPESELSVPPLPQDVVLSRPPSPAKSDTGSLRSVRSHQSRSDRRSKSRVIEPQPDVSMELIDEVPSPTSVHPEEIESDDILATEPPEGQPSRVHSATLHHYDDNDDDRDELDLIGSPAPSPKSARTLSASRSQSVIHIIDSPEAGEVLEVEGETQEEESKVEIYQPDGLEGKTFGEVPATPEEGEVVEAEPETPVDHETEVEKATSEPEANISEENRDLQAMVEEEPVVQSDEKMSPEQESKVVDDELAIPDDETAEDEHVTPEAATPITEEIPITPIEERQTEGVMPPEEGEVDETLPEKETSPPQHEDTPMLFESSTINATPPRPLLPRIPFVPVIAEPPQRPIIIIEPSSSHPTLPAFNFNVSPPSDPTPPSSPSQARQYHHFNPQYTLPPLKALPVEFNRKGKLTKQQRKREKEREKNERGSEKNEGKKENKDDWVPMGLNKWGATLNVNPVWKKVSRANKCLSTRDWGIAMTELRLIRTLDRVEQLKDGGRWSFRQPKKQRGVGGLAKTHWDYVMDEMKWMRIDFREERKWKMTLAYNLSTAVLEWHAAESLAERVGRGICVLWKRPRVEIEEKVAEEIHAEPAEIQMEVDEQSSPVQPKNALLMVDYGSDDDEDYDQDKDQQSVVDALETAALIEDVLDAVDRGEVEQGTGLKSFEPKTEDIDDSSALQNGGDSMDTDIQQDAVSDDPMGGENDGEEESADAVPSGLKTSSTDPLLGSKSNSQSSIGDEPPSTGTKLNSKTNMYAPLRERIAYSDEHKLFLDLEDLDLAKGISDLSTDDPTFEALLPPPDLTTIFPDLQPLGLLDVVPIVTSVAPEGKKKSEKRSDRDDPNKRAEDTTYTKLVPIGKFMYCKPTLLGPLQPSKRWKNGQWVNLDENAVASEYENPSGRISEENLCELFEANKYSPSMNQSIPSLPPPKERRAVDHLWTSNDDALLKTLTDKYPNNWALVSECFNASRVTISTDKRTPRNCYERWDGLWGPSSRVSHHAQDIKTPLLLGGTPPPPPPPTPGQMTTRGVKRLASTSVSGPNAGGSAFGSEPKKRRRHLLMQETIRKVSKQRMQAAQKAALSQRKPSAIHDTHGQYNKMPRLTPDQLSRMKADREARDIQDMATARRRQEELSRQQQQQHQQQQLLLRDQAHRLALAANGQPGAQQPQANGAQRPPGPSIPQAQGVAIRSQVNISQQQRIATPMSANSRMSPQQQQLLQAQHLHQAQGQQVQQVQGQQAQAQMHAQAQAQVQAQNIPPNMNGVSTAMSNPHISPPHAPRDATSPPHGAYTSPPRNTATPTNATNSPRPPSAQAQAGILQASQGNVIARPTNMGGHYFLPNMPNMQNTQFTPEQIQAAMRIQLAQQAQQAAQQAAHQQGMSQQPGSQSGSFPSQS